MMFGSKFQRAEPCNHEALSEEVARLGKEIEKLRIDLADVRAAAILETYNFNSPFPFTVAKERAYTAIQAVGMLLAHCGVAIKKEPEQAAKTVLVPVAKAKKR